MRGEYIDFIAEYCDRWCERCPFTSRCSSYAVRIATEMCDGDLGAGIELAVGAPPPRDETERLEREAVLKHVGNYDPTDQEMKQAEREDEERDERIDEFPVSTRSQAVAMLVHRWLEDHGDRVSTRANATVTEAIGIAARHGFFIHVKLLRALDGRDRAMRGEEPRRSSDSERLERFRESGVDLNRQLD